MTFRGYRVQIEKLQVEKLDFEKTKRGEKKPKVKQHPRQQMQIEEVTKLMKMKMTKA